ncbi:spermidine synthase [Marinobacter sp. JSM 1782161]|uniref:spermidine synthase n=1 Tax=Marinobacter sp. JSM 1782161 TaxID=2685906 RepID=UPI0014038E42|nr:methyltransferase domain-containing protein [Marinobacter sp. JSM 1782161]
MPFRLNGNVTYETGDALGPIRVLDYRKHRVLTFDSVFEQSKIARRKPWLPVHEYNRAMLLPLAFTEPARATVLGVGGGVMIGALHRLLPDCDIHGVELRQAVVDVAREYFHMPDDPRVRISVSDVRPALRDMPDTSTDLILTDLYSADRMSPVQAHRRFIDQCSRVLSDTGWLAMNFHLAPARDGTLVRHLARLFPEVMLYRTRTNNYVIYASKQPVAIPPSSDPTLAALEKRLPIGWSGLVEKLMPQYRAMAEAEETTA